MSADDRVGYQYVVLRCVPRVDREEFVNVGVVMYSQRAEFLQCPFEVDVGRIQALAPGFDVGSRARRADVGSGDRARQARLPPGQSAVRDRRRAVA